MKLRKGILTHSTNGEQIMIGVGEADFHGFARNNETAAFIVDCLKEETTPEAVVEKLAGEYDAPREKLERDVQKIIEKLRGIGALQE